MNEGRSKRLKKKGRSYKEVVGAMRAAKDRTAREKKIEKLANSSSHWKGLT